MTIDQDALPMRAVYSKKTSPLPAQPPLQKTELQQLKVIQLVPVLHNVLLNLASHSPRDKVLVVARHQVGRVCDLVDADADVALLDELCGGLDGLGHAQAGHDDGEAAAGKGADGDVVLDGGELGGGGEDAHVVELCEEEVFVFAAGGVFGGEEGEAVGELADGLWRKKNVSWVY